MNYDQCLNVWVNDQLLTTCDVDTLETTPAVSVKSAAEVARNTREPVSVGSYTLRHTGDCGFYVLIGPGTEAHPAGLAFDSVSELDEFLNERLMAGLPV